MSAEVVQSVKPVNSPNGQVPGSERNLGKKSAGDHKPDQDASVHRQTDLADKANHKALLAARKAAPGTPLHHVDVSDASNATTASTEQPSTLSEDTLKKKAQLMHDALTHQSFGFINSPEAQKVLDELKTLNKADKQALEKVYQEMFRETDTSLRNKLTSCLTAVESSQAICLLDKSDDRTNDAGNLMVAVAMLKEDASKGNTMLRDVLLNKSNLTQLEADCQKQFHKSVKQILDGAANLDGATREALPYLTKDGKLTVEETMALAKIAVKYQNLDLLNQALRGDDAKAVKAREELQKDTDFQKKFNLAFSGENSGQAHDILKEGRASLTSIADRDTHHFLGVYDNKENLELALTHASDKERELYIQGRALAGKKDLTGSDAQALQFYNQLHMTFLRDGNAREATQWEADLVYGKDNLISQLAGSHSNGWADGQVFGIGAGHDINELSSVVEHMSEKDWERLHNPHTRQAFREEISRSLSTYASAQEREELLKLIDAKAKATSFSESQKISRDLVQVVADNQTGFFGNVNKSQSQIVDSVLHLNQDDINKYLHDQKFKANIDAVVKTKLDGAAQLLAQRTLDKLTKTGKQPEMDAIDRVLCDDVHHTPVQNALKDFEAVLTDKSLRDRLNLPFDQMSAQDKLILGAINDSFSESLRKAIWSDPQAAQKLADNYVATLLKNGSLSLSDKLSLDVPHLDLIPAIATAAPAERKQAEKYLNQSEIAVVEHAAQNSGKLDLVDQFRLATIEKDKDPHALGQLLDSLNSAQKSELKNQYQTRYHSDLDSDLLARVDKSERDTFKSYLSTDKSDGRQEYYDHLKEYMNHSGGFTRDGSELTTQRALSLQAEALKEYQDQLKKLPPEKQKLLNEFFGPAFEQYKDSKEKLAEITIDATLTAAALAAAPFSGGLSLVEVGYIAAGSAAFRVGTMMACQGKDFESTPENILKQCIIGGTSGGLNFLGPEAIAGCRALGQAVTARVSRDLMEGALKQTLRADAEDILKKSLPSLVRNGDQAAMEKLAASLLKSGATEAEEKALAESLKESVRVNKATEKAVLSAKLAKKGMLQASAESAAIGSGANIVSDLAVAPFNKDGIDWQQLQRSAITGLAVGAIMPVVFRGAAAGVKSGKNIFLNLTRGADGIYFDPAINGKFSVTDSAGQTKVYEPGSREVYRPRPGDRIENGPVELSAPRDLRTQARDAGAHPLEMAGDSGKDVIKVGNQVLQPGQELTIGRSPDKNVVLTQDTVSRNHAVIGRDAEGRLYIKDTGSANGTYVNGHRLESNKSYYIGEGDTVRLGSETRLPITREVVAPKIEPSINGQKLDLSHGEVLVGRGKFGITSQYVSSDHLAVGSDARGTYIVDRYSTNGTYVNGQKIKPNERFYLKPTDRVQLSSQSSQELRLSDLADAGRHPGDGRLQRGPENNQRGAERLEYPQNKIPSQAATAQSNHYATTHQESARLEPGFQNAGGYAKFDGNGMASDLSRPATIFDPAHDPVLRAKISEAHTLFDRYRNDPLKLAQELTKYSRDLLTPPEGDKTLDSWYAEFNRAHAGRKVLLGEFLQAGKGVCSQQAFMLKVLADEFGLQCTMVRGMQGRHAWTTMTIGGKKLIFDPRMQQLGKEPHKLPIHTPGMD
jgi:pSer/pThr/pTyr-binding forkhead associated (FHA) protein